MDLSFKLSDNSKKLENFVKDPMQPLLISVHFLTSVLMRWSARMQKYPALQNYS